MKNDWKANNFDFLRLALAVLVIYSHGYPLGVGSEVAEPFKVATHGQVTGGGIAVDLFFIMSGFLITASAERSRGVGVFLQKRVARIYPAFVVCALLTLLVFLPLSQGGFAPVSWWGRVGDFVLQTLRLHEFHYAGAFRMNPYPDVINGSVWSIQYEFWCYIGVALLLTLGLLRRRGVLLAIFAAALVVSILFQVEGWRFGGKVLGIVFGAPVDWSRLLPLYLAGMVFYLYREKIRLHWVGAVLCAVLLVVASQLSFGWTAMFPFVGAYLVFYVAFAPWLRLHRFGKFGDFSYGTYLYAFPIEQVVVKMFGHAVAPWLVFVCAAPLTLLVAVASWYGVERRFLRPARQRESVEQVETAAVGVLAKA